MTCLLVRPKGPSTKIMRTLDLDVGDACYGLGQALLIWWSWTLRAGSVYRVVRDQTKDASSEVGSLELRKCLVPNTEEQDWLKNLPRGPKYPIYEASGSKNHALMFDGLWDQSP